MEDSNIITAMTKYNIYTVKYSNQTFFVTFLYRRSRKYTTSIFTGISPLLPVLVTTHKVKGNLPNGHTDRYKNNLTKVLGLLQ